MAVDVDYMVAGTKHTFTITLDNSIAGASEVKVALIRVSNNTVIIEKSVGNGVTIGGDNLTLTVVFDEADTVNVPRGIMRLSALITDGNGDLAPGTPTTLETFELRELDGFS